LNTIQLDCPACGGDTTVSPDSKWNQRTNSRVSRANCSRCSHEFFLKQFIPHKRIPSQPKGEYATLQLAYHHFPVDSNYRVAKPVEYSDSYKIIMMEYEEGDALPVALKNADKYGRMELASRAGKWLSRLHNCREVDTSKPLTVWRAAPRLVELKEEWEDEKNHQDEILKTALDLLSGTVTELDEQRVERVWIHGDFTPDNILVNGDTIVGLDIGWGSNANPVMDLAPFLNHLGLVTTRGFGFATGKDTSHIEEAFLRGYRQTTSARQMLLLDWYRLYFLLCYRLSSLQSGMARRYLTKAQFNPQIARMTEKLEFSSSNQ
jgi:Ser/Thr protein kinase RdoA (MazF antagonist)